MQGDLEETVGIAGQRVPRRLWEAEIVLRCAAWVAGIHGATLLRLGILTGRLRIQVFFLPERIECILAGTALLGASALICHRRGRGAILATAALHVLYTMYLVVVMVTSLQRFGWSPGELLLRLFEPWAISVLLAILLPVFVAVAVLGRSAKEAFSPALRGNPLAPISSCPHAGASVRAWAALGIVVLSLVHLLQILLQF